MKTPMKTTILLGTMALAAPLPLRAAAPGELHYQGKLADTAGNPLTGSHNIRFRICDAVSGGSCAYYDQTASGVAVTNGVCSIQVGASPMAAIPGTALQGGADRWLLVSVDGADLAPRQKLVAAPYALSVPANSIGTAELADNAVTTAKIL